MDALARVIASFLPSQQMLLSQLNDDQWVALRAAVRRFEKQAMETSATIARLGFDPNETHANRVVADAIAKVDDHERRLSALEAKGKS